MSTSILGIIQHYQRSIENSQGNEKRLIHCIEKLYNLPVKVEHLQETGIGKTVNSLRKYHGEIGVAAKTLVTKWKSMVAAEEESSAQTNGNTNNDQANISSAPDSSDEDSDDNQHIHTSNQPSLNINPAASKEHKSSDRHKSSTRENGKQQRHESNGKSSTTTSAKSSNCSEEKSLKISQDNSSKHRKHSNHHDEKEAPAEKKHKRDDREKSERREGNEKQHKHEKSDKQKQRTDGNIPDSEVRASTSSKNKTTCQDSRDKKDSSKSNHIQEKSSKHQDSEKHSSSSGKDKHRSDKSKEDKHDKTKTSSRDKSSEHDSKSSKSTSHSTSSSKSATSSTSSVKSTKKRQLNEDDDSSSETSPKSKVHKSSKHKTSESNDGDDGIDSSMGANFADVLGMLNKPTKKSKKSLNALKSPTVNATSNKTSTKEDNRSKINASSQNDGRSTSTASTSSSVKYKPSDMKPDLLTSSAKLEPLDPSIMLELPAISTNYKPLPVNPTVMECVYNNFAPPTTPKPPVRTLTDAEALSHGISSKTMRTKIYSGIKTGQVLQVPSLFDLCIRILQKNIDALEYTGGVPFEVLRPVLERATPQQLLIFEDYNPYLMEDSDVLWQHHVQRNYRCKKRQEMESWREMYLRCQEEEERRLNSLTQSIKQSQKIIAAPVRKTQLAFVDSMVKPPRNILRKQEQYGTKAKLVATPAARVAALSSVTPNAAKVGDTRLRIAPSVRDTAQVSNAAIRPKKAPLMAKTLQSMRGLYKR